MMKNERRVLLGLTILSALISFVIAQECTSFTPNNVLEFDSHIIPPSRGVIRNERAYLSKGTYLMRLVRPLSVPYKFTHIYLRYNPSEQIDVPETVKFNVVTQKAVPTTITDADWTKCPKVSFAPSGNKENLQEVDACLPTSASKNYVQIPLTTPIITYERAFFIGISVNDAHTVVVPYLALNNVESMEQDCWQYYKMVDDKTTLSGANIGIALGGEEYEPDDVIPGWNCTRAKYGNGECDCWCGITDVDCLSNATSKDCGSGEVCWDSVCKNVGWVESPKDGQGNKACELSHYGSDDYCDVGCGLGFASLDPDCLFPDKPIKTPGVKRTCDPTLNFCLPDAWTCDPVLYNGTICHCELKCGISDPSCDDREHETTCPNNMVCVDDVCDHPRDWTCGDHEYNTGGSCECGCTVYDPDCDFSRVTNCPDDARTCRPNATCTVPACGNNFVDIVALEECDGGLGCSTSTCTCLQYYEPYNRRQLDCHPICGDKMVVEGEECDSTPGCLDNCTCRPGLTASNKQCLGCGNTILEAGEECDQTANCDNATCKCLEGFVQDGSLNSCVKESNSAILAVAIVVPVVVIAIIVVAIILVWVFKKKKRDEEAAVKAAVQSVAMEEMTAGGSAKPKEEIIQAKVVGEPATHLDKWGVEPATADFGSGGMPIDVGVTMEQGFSIKNLCYKDFHYSITVPKSNKFLLSVVPENGTVNAGYSLAFRLTGILYCSKMITNAPIAVSVSFTEEDGSAVKEYVLVDLVMQGKPSYLIDYDDLVFDKVIGEGSFGSVYKGSYTTHPAAIKTLKALSQEALNDFVREIDMLGKLRHPYVVTFYGAVITHDKLCLVTEYMALGSLGAVLKKYSLSARLKVRLSLDAAKGLAFLHEMNVMHRDIKPGNVLCSSLDLSAPVLCKISDFGTSRVDTGVDAQDKNKGMGTPLYMAPEIFNGSATYSRAADVFSFGIMLSQIWNESPPYFDCHFDTPFALASHVSAGNRPTIIDGCPDFFLQIMQQCWAGDPAQRPSFADCVAFLQQVNDALEQQGDAPGTVHVVEKRSDKD